MNKEHDTVIDELRAHWYRRVKEEKIDAQLALYIPMMLGFTEKDEIEKRLSGVDEVQRFLASDKQLMLLLGDSGAGKSLFGLWFVNYLWGVDQNIIPLFIHLPSIKIKKEFLEKYLKKQCGITDVEIVELKTHHRLLLIFDSYDEMKPKYKGKNLHQVGELYRWNAKVIISCRTEALMCYSLSEQSTMFMPYGVIEKIKTGWEKRYLQEFDPKTQIPTYIDQWKALNPELVDSTVNYLELLTTLPHISEMITNPFILWIVLLSLPKILKKHELEKKNIQRMHLTRLSLFDAFTKAWFERQSDKLLKNDLINAARSATIVDDYHLYCEQLGNLMWQKKITNVKYEVKLRPLRVKKLTDDKELHKDNCIIYLVEQDDLIVAHYHNGNEWCSSSKERSDLEKILPTYMQLTEWTEPVDVKNIHSLYCGFSWDVFFANEESFNGDPSKPLALIRQGAILRVFAGNNYAFLHTALLEYFSAENMFKSALNKASIVLGLEINSQLFIQDKARIRLGADCVQENPEFEDVLWDILEESKYESRVSIAAANAATILAAANRSFAGRDLRRMRIKGADVSGGNFEGTNLEESDLRDVNINEVWLNRAKISGSCTDNLKIGVLKDEKIAGGVISCALSPQGNNYVVSTSKIIYVYDVHRHCLLKPITFDFEKFGKLSRMCLHPFQEEVLVGTRKGMILLLSLLTGELRQYWNAHKESIVGIAIHPNGKWVFSRSFDYTTKRWDILTKECLKIWAEPKETLANLPLSSDGKFIMSASSRGEIIIYDSERNKCIKRWNSDLKSIDNIIISHNCEWVISTTSNDFVINRWSVNNGECLASWFGHGARICTVIISLDDKWVLSGSQDLTIKCWDVDSGVCLRALRGHTNTPSAIAIGHDLSWIVSGSLNEIKRWDLRVGDSLAKKEVEVEHFVRFAVSKDWSWVIAEFSIGGKNRIRKWDVKSGRCEAIWESSEEYASAIVLSHDDKIAITGSGKEIKCWDVKSGECLETFDAHHERITTIACSSDSTFVLSGSFDETIKKWDLKSGKCTAIWESHENTIGAIVLSRDDKFAITGSGEKIKRWDVMSGQCNWVLDSSCFCFNVSSLALSIDEQWVVSGSLYKEVNFINVMNGRRIRVSCEHKLAIHAIVRSSNGKWILSGDTSRLLILWDAVSHQIHKHFEFPFGISSMSWPEGNPSLVIIGMMDGSLSAWTFDEQSLSFSLKWRTKSWGLHVEYSQLLGVYGLDKDREDILSQKGSLIQVSSKKSEDVLSQREQIQTYNSDYPPCCLFDPTIKIRREAWAVSVVRKKVWDVKKEKNDPTQHAFLILESIEEGYYRVRRIDFVLEKRHQYSRDEYSNTTGRKLGFFGQGLIEVADKSLFDLKSLVEQCCAKSTGISFVQGMKLLENIRLDQNKRIGYCLPGSGEMYRIFRMKDAAEHHNCLSWCEVHLSNIGVQLTQNTWKDGVLNDPRSKIREEHPLPTKDLHDNNASEDPSSRDKCGFM